ncbi:hypothetical protein AVU67_gp43 [Ralstonia phage RSJ2]|uniref:Uncharacterized protein n=1 Tax=Ralstonia phage RSJ2 TaxID=1481785 RepID=A0A068Q7U3_9CAUD|nr:hypothetical protein AVU67_gp43 [Ralstonia phage RSJ2]BAP15849.1 hypothetical protein [Ralstonia phage RSJ2]
MRIILNTVTVAPYGAQVTFVGTKVGWLGQTGERAPVGVCGLSQGHGDGRFTVGVFSGGLSTLIHECCHCAMQILEHYGIDPRDSQGEVMAYLTEWLVTVARSKKGQG